MNIVILGAGRVGYQLAKQLIEENRDVAVIEKDPARARNISDLLDCLVINEDAHRLDALKQAGIEKADYFVAVTDSDEVNLITCGIVANEFNVPTKIARVRNIVITDDESSLHSFLGIDFIVNLEVELTRAITAAIDRGALSDIMLFEESEMQVRSITVDRDSALDGRSMEEISSVLIGTYLIVVILRNNEYIIPTGRTRVHEDDKLYILASEGDFNSIFDQLGNKSEPIETIVVIGGGRIGQHVIEHLYGDEPAHTSLISRMFGKLRPSESTKNIRIIELDPQVCKMLSEKFPHALVLNADISDDRFQEDEYLSDADLVITTSDNQELNIVNAVYAKTLGTKRTVALVNRSSFVHVATDIGVDVAISPIDSMVSTILKHIRKSNVRRVHNISGSSIDIIELSVENNGRVAGNEIRQIKLPEQSLIISVTRDGESMFPNADTRIQEGDHLIIITHKESIPRLESLINE